MMITAIALGLFGVVLFCGGLGLGFNGAGRFGQMACGTVLTVIGGIVIGGAFSMFIHVIEAT